jgi:hypothetical protein
MTSYETDNSTDLVTCASVHVITRQSQCASQLCIYYSFYLPNKFKPKNSDINDFFGRRRVLVHSVLRAVARYTHATVWTQLLWQVCDETVACRCVVLQSDCLHAPTLYSEPSEGGRRCPACRTSIPDGCNPPVNYQLNDIILRLQLKTPTGTVQRCRLLN